MIIKLENLPYQETAIKSIVKIFEGTEKNTFDNACFEGIRSNYCNLSLSDQESNIIDVITENGIPNDIAKLSKDNDICIEMETGTGKTLVYVKTIYELFKHYGFSKFIILVPSVAIRQNIIGTFKGFDKQLENIYGFTPNAFEYDSKKLPKVTQFIEDQHPQVMIMTLASFNSEDKILNQAQREDLFNNKPFIEAIADTNPIIIMDEPQEGMDTDNSIKQIAKLNPLIKIRYSATHKVFKNLIYRLTPYDSYKDGLVKKIEVLTVTEKNDEATLKIELSDIQFGKGDPKVKLKAWHLNKTNNKIEFKITAWLNLNDNLGEKTNNPSYLKYVISNINKSLRTGKWTVTFSNGAEIIEKQIAGGLENIWALQLEWLIHRHFTKSQKLVSKNIKCLSLIFIDRVANYMGETPIIKNLFIEKYKAIYPEYNDGKQSSNEQIQSIQGYYFAQKSSGEFADNEGGINEQRKIYDAILKDKEELLQFGNSVANKIEFVFSHSALGVGWDNPNVFNIATLSNSFSEIKKRQEIGRGLRICVNQDGQRVYDALDVDDNERVNQLTVIPNETYETFVTQYQEEIKSLYGTTNAGAGMTNTHKGIAIDEVKFKRNSNQSIEKAFRKYWEALAKKTEYTMVFNEEALINDAATLISKITIPDFVIEASSFKIDALTEDGKQDTFQGSEKVKQKSTFTPLDLIEELSENTGISYKTLFKILERITNLLEIIK
ncbi:DEAD/DEAH box helicase family protein, partial [Flavobacterium sp.]|uniref:DEAD/DEAH box helicase family protein n=1 Tax=Flavobacterium sp. TaxID=239 RepID=UPI003751148B